MMRTRYSTDQEIPEDGMYHVFHEAHRLIRSVLLFKGDRFPRCSQCHDQVAFELMYTVEPDPGLLYERLRVFELPLQVAE